ncbi:MAG: 3'(2'),5'-bisphosphate nucleotidase CysQ [Pseudomonadota bacterium]
MSEKLLDHLPALCNQVRRIALEAGEVTLDYFDDAGFEGADAKADGSPVTLADQKAEEVIEKALKDILPDVKVVGEEAVADGYRPQLEGVEHFWLVDPLDGTKEFISGSGDYTVNIALIKNGTPVMGVVYAPTKGELFAAAGEGTAIRWTDESEKDRPISVREAPREGLTVVASLNHSNDEKLEKFLADYKVQKLMKRGSSLKICAVAMGKADLYPRLGPTCEWDTAAGHAILLGAGGIMTDIDNKPLTYGGADPKFLNPEFIASSGLI